MFPKLYIFIFSIFILLSTGCFAQFDGESLYSFQTAIPTPVQSTQPGAEQEKTPKPYEEDEFPRWLKDLRRAEVILIGSIPFTMFISFEIFDVYRYVSANFEPVYAPWPFKGPETPAYTENDKITIIITAVALSATIALIDYIIVKVKKNKKIVPESKK